MYLLIAVLLMAILLICSLPAEALVFGGSTDLFLSVGKWFAFWAVESSSSMLVFVRSPGRSSQLKAFGTKNKDPWPIVRELGFANVSMGVLGVASIVISGLTHPAAIACGLFFGIAGIAHLFRKERNFPENLVFCKRPQR